MLRLSSHQRELDIEQRSDESYGNESPSEVAAAYKAIAQLHYDDVFRSVVSTDPRVCQQTRDERHIGAINFTVLILCTDLL